jgi:hypothetical protein
LLSKGANADFTRLSHVHFSRKLHFVDCCAAAEDRAHQGIFVGKAPILCGVFAYVAKRDASRQKFRIETVVRNIT